MELIFLMMKYRDRRRGRQNLEYAELFSTVTWDLWVKGTYTSNNPAPYYFVYTHTCKSEDFVSYMWERESRLSILNHTHIIEWLEVT